MLLLRPPRTSTRCIRSTALSPRLLPRHTDCGFSSTRHLATRAKHATTAGKKTATIDARSAQVKTGSKPSDVHKNSPAPKPFTGENLIPDLPAPTAFTFKGAKGNAPATPASDATAFPAQLLVYHAGTTGVSYVAVWKLTAMLGFFFGGLYLAPYYFYSPDEETIMAPIIFIGAAIPVFVLTYSTYPIITFVHLNLPQWARLSRDRLLKYIANLPPSATVDITSLRWIWPRATRMRISELFIPGISTAQRAPGTPTASVTIGDSFNLRRRVPQEVLQARQWWQWRPEKAYLVWGKGVKVKDDLAWAELLKSIQKGTGQRGSASIGNTGKNQ